MKKFLVYGSVFSLAVITMSSCKGNKESAYKAAYEQAVAERNATEVTPVQQATPVVVTPVTTTASTPAPAPVQQKSTAAQNVAVQTESVTLVSGAALKAYSVVVGSFGVQANAERRQADLKREGYEARVVLNPLNSMYRVIATTFDAKDDAVQSRAVLRQKYPDAWLLYAK